MKLLQQKQTAQPPPTREIDDLRVAARTCLVCEFAKASTQTVFGEGSRKPVLMLVGEVPGDVEDLNGHPFSGPAGRLLKGLLAEIGVSLASVYLTNAVKHFKYTRVGKRRLHQKPNVGEIRACRPWLIAEIASLKPRVIVALGKTAAESLCDRKVSINKERGNWTTTPVATNVRVLISWHPSAVLRSQDDKTRARLKDELKSDFLAAWKSADDK